MKGAIQWKKNAKNSIEDPDCIRHSEKLDENED